MQQRRLEMESLRSLAHTPGLDGGDASLREVARADRRCAGKRGDQAESTRDLSGRLRQVRPASGSSTPGEGLHQHPTTRGQQVHVQPRRQAGTLEGTGSGARTPDHGPGRAPRSAQFGQRRSARSGGQRAALQGVVPGRRASQPQLRARSPRHRYLVCQAARLCRASLWG